MSFGTEESEEEIEKPETPVTPKVVAPKVSFKSPKKYCYRNPFLPVKDTIRRTKTPFPGLPQPEVEECGSRMDTDFIKFRKRLGQGDFGYCYKVLHVLDGCYYAIKISKGLYQLLQPNSYDVMRAQAEYQAMAYLGSHKNLVGYYGAWYEHDLLHIQLEFCEETLEAKSHRGALTSERDFQNTLYQVAKGLEHIHTNGVVHLDIKPANILVKDGVYKIGDFGLAGFADEEIGGSYFTTAGDGRYMPANYEDGEPTKVDIFALGISIYELMMRHNLGNPRAVNIEMKRSYNVEIDLNLPGYSRRFLELLQAMVDNDPEQRPSATDIVKNPVLNAVRALYEMH